MPYNACEVPVHFDSDEVILKLSAPLKKMEYSSFDVFVKGLKKQGTKYVRYHMGFCHDIRDNSHLFRLVNAYLTDRIGECSFVGDEMVIQEGEWEMAIRETENGVTADDFVGGFHGDENLTRAYLRVDCKEVDLLGGAHEITGEKIEFYQESLLNRCNTIGQNVANHTKKYIFTKDGLTLEQRVEWLSTFEVEACYMTMLPIYRCSAAKRLCDLIDVYDGNGNRRMSYNTSGIAAGVSGNTTLGTGELISAEPPVTRAVASSADGSLLCTVEQIAKAGIQNRRFMLDVRQYNDNKIYFSNNAGTTARIGDVWEMTSIYGITYTQ